MKNYKYISENTIKGIDLHDCECKRLYYKEPSLVVVDPVIHDFFGD